LQADFVNQYRNPIVTEREALQAIGAIKACAINESWLLNRWECEALAEQEVLSTWIHDERRTHRILPKPACL
jgi:hypothetical protein